MTIQIIHCFVIEGVLRIALWVRYITDRIAEQLRCGLQVFQSCKYSSSEVARSKPTKNTSRVHDGAGVPQRGCSPDSCDSTHGCHEVAARWRPLAGLAVNCEVLATVANQVELTKTIPQCLARSVQHDINIIGREQGASSAGTGIELLLAHPVSRVKFRYKVLVVL